MNMSPPSALVQHPQEKTPSPVDATERQGFAVQKSRKYSTGGGRAWSEDEEIYLLQTRLQKMPYKHIAAHLMKTELACRLHYHQLSNGTNRRKRTVSISSVSSAGQSSVAAEERASPDAYASTAPTTPDNNTPLEGSPVSRKASIDQSPLSVAASPDYARKNVLPAPAMSAPQPGLCANIRESLRLDCNVAASRLTPMINKDRLREIYETHRVSFWKMIAAEYGEGVNPAALEEMWNKGSVQASYTPPSETPAVAPHRAHDDKKVGPPLSAMSRSAMSTDHSARGFSPINSSVSSSSAHPIRHPSVSYFSLPTPTPSTAATSAGPIFSAASEGPLAATSITNLLNSSTEIAIDVNGRVDRHVSSIRYKSQDVQMRDVKV